MHCGDIVSLFRIRKKGDRPKRGLLIGVLFLCVGAGSTPA